MKVTLRKPLDLDGKTISSLDLDLGSLTGKQIIEAEQEARMKGDASPNPLYSAQGLAILAARASGHKADDITDLVAPDFVLITTMVSNFLYGWDSPIPTQSATSGDQS